MAIVSVAADSARFDAMDATGNISGIGGGAGAGVEPDIVYQGAASISRKVTGAGFYTTTGATRDLTATGRTTWICKVWLTNYGSLSTSGNKLEVRCGSGTTAYHAYVLGSPTVDYPARGGWVIVAIDPSVASHRSSTTGAPVLTAADFFGTYADCSSSKGENLCLDAIDVGVGLHLTAGDGADPDGTFADFVAADEGSGRFGYVFTEGGILYAQGRMIIGATSASGTRTAAATEFTDSGAVVVFPDHLAAAGYSGITVDLGSASTAVAWTSCTFSGRGSSAGEDTRPVVDILGASGTFEAVGCAFTNFEHVDISAGGAFVACTLNSVGSMALAGTLTDCACNDHTTASAVAMITTADLGLISGCAFDNTGGVGHAIEITAAGTYDLSATSFSGYGPDGSNDAAIYNNSGGAITINVTGGGGTPTVRNGAGASTIVNNAVTLTITGLAPASEVTLVRASDEAILDHVDSTGSTYSYAYNYTTDTGVYINVRHIDFEYLTIEGVTLTSSDASIPVTQVDDRIFANP